MAKVIDATFYHGKAEGGINSYEVTVGSDHWEIQELLNSEGKVYFRLAIRWNDITTHDFWTAIRKQFLQTPVAAHETVVTPLS